MGENYEDPAGTTQMARMRLDRPKNMRASASAAALEGAARPDASAKPLYNLNYDGAQGGGGGAALGALQAMRGEVESDDEDDGEGRYRAAGIGPLPHAVGGSQSRVLTTSSSTAFMLRQGQARRPPAATPAVAASQPPPTPAEDADGGAARSAVSDAVISARLKHARQQVQQREETTVDPWHNGGDKGDDSDSDLEGEGDGGGPVGARRASAEPAEGEEAGEEAEPLSVDDGESLPAAAQAEAAPGKLSAEEISARQLEQARLFARDPTGWLRTPAPAGEMLQCVVTRDRSGFDLLFPQYRCYLQTPEGDRFLMAARKRKKSNSNNYVISSSMKDLARRSDSCIGKLRSNFIGTEFVLYDGGYNPAKPPKGLVGGKDKDGRGVRSELGVCINTPNVVGAPAPRKMKAIMPRLVQGQLAEYRPTAEQETILAREKDGRLAQDFMVLASKQPRFNNATGKYSLNFGGRIKTASVKNMQVTFAGQDDVLLQFGKRGKDEFVVDFQYPFTPLQAFAFGLTALAYKLANEGG